MVQRITPFRLPARIRGATTGVIKLDNGVPLDFAAAEGPVQPHYAFLASEAEFDAIFGRICEWHLGYWVNAWRRILVKFITTMADAESNFSGLGDRPHSSVEWLVKDRA